jgi:predicted ATPase
VRPSRRPARFIEGKYDQYRRNVPYSGLSRAFGQLIGQVLAEPEEHLARWRRALHEALGTIGQVLVEIVPEIAFLIGPQAEVPRLGPNETENRFHLAFQRFLEVMCNAEHPLVLFLDDLQWADSASLRWVRRILSEPGVGHLLIIGAYRGSEVDTTHPLMMALDAPASRMRASLTSRSCRSASSMCASSSPILCGAARPTVTNWPS